MPEIESSNVTPRALAIHALIYGGIAGLLAGIWMMIEFALGWETTRADIGKYSSLAALIFPIGGTILGLMVWRNTKLGGRITFMKAFGPALAIGLAFSFAMTACAWIHAAYITPDLIEQRIAYQAQLKQKEGASAADIEKWKQDVRPQATPQVYAYNMFVFSLPQMLFISLIASIGVPRRSPLLVAAEAKV